ncbi:hypothetical protein DFP72DRAFT_850963 [Ephemerocybe angulata]|uniref:Uncharacterized protein n=1 Tax=Ephemerocybe angulata TaxID=980116 RepID=A0A8H6M3Y3_9AGAR|nr:hypothetical protein DFP72DRAFT_850963 [Tulosesus angulatus]
MVYTEQAEEPLVAVAGVEEKLCSRNMGSDCRGRREKSLGPLPLKSRMIWLSKRQPHVGPDEDRRSRWRPMQSSRLIHGCGRLSTHRMQPLPDSNRASSSVLVIQDVAPYLLIARIIGAISPNPIFVPPESPSLSASHPAALDPLSEMKRVRVDSEPSPRGFFLSWQHGRCTGGRTNGVPQRPKGLDGPLEPAVVFGLTDRNPIVGRRQLTQWRHGVHRTLTESPSGLPQTRRDKAQLRPE